MIAVAWITFDGARVDESQVEWRNGILQHKLETGLPQVSALNFSNETSPEMWERAHEYVKSLEYDHVAILECEELSEVKSAVLQQLKRG